MPTPGQRSAMAAEVRADPWQAAECAWAGARRGLALCAAYYAELVCPFGAVDRKKAEARLLVLAGALQMAANVRDPRADLPPAALGAESDGPLPMPASAHGPGALLRLPVHTGAAIAGTLAGVYARGAALHGCFGRGARASVHHLCPPGSSSACLCVCQALSKEALVATAHRRCLVALVALALHPGARSLGTSLHVRQNSQPPGTGLALPYTFSARLQLDTLQAGADPLDNHTRACECSPPVWYTSRCGEACCRLSCQARGLCGPP